VPPLFPIGFALNYGVIIRCIRPSTVDHILYYCKVSLPHLKPFAPHQLYRLVKAPPQCGLTLVGSVFVLGFSPQLSHCVGVISYM
jgi:hypothetical protein